MHWYPFRDLGGVKQANLDAAVNLEIADGKARVAFGTTSARQSAHAVLKAGEKVLVDEKINIDPRKPFVKTGIEIPAGTDEHDVRASLTADGKELVAYSPLRLKSTPMPSPVAQPGRQKTSKRSRSFTWRASGSSSFTPLARSRNRIGRRRSSAIRAIRELTRHWEFAI